MLDLKPAETVSYVALRVIAGLAFSFHGMAKLFGVLAGGTTDDSQMWVGGVIELGGLLIAAGLLTRAAAFLASGTMAVAYIQFHWKLDFGEKFFPIKNGGELALIYCFLFLFITFRGAGPASLDSVIFKKR